MSFSQDSKNQTQTWPSAVPPKRWWGARRDHPGVRAFESLDHFIVAQQSELLASLNDHERATLGRLLARGQKLEIEVFLRTHGANPLFDPHAEIETPLGIAKADQFNLSAPPSAAALSAILEGRVVHALFQAGEASRFQQGPFYSLNPTQLARNLGAAHASQLDEIDRRSAHLPKSVADFLVHGPMGPKQSAMIRAALRRAVEWEIQLGWLPRKNGLERYARALKSQLLLYFVNKRSGLADLHDRSLRQFGFFGFDPSRIATIEQDLIPGIRLDEEGHIFLRTEDWAADAAGHLYALIQAARPGNFFSYDAKGHKQDTHREDALAYLFERGGRHLSVIRINDMDRHTTEVVNPRMLTYALSQFEKGAVNVIEAVANPTGQKGGTGITLGNPDNHVLTETHENTFPAFSRAFEAAMARYLEKNQGQHPAYNAMRQWADLQATRRTLRDFGGRIVFVPRKKDLEGASEWSVGVDMPMGDLSLLGSAYPSRMVQAVDPVGRELAIHDMKQTEQLPFYLETVLFQLQDPFVTAAVSEILGQTPADFSTPQPIPPTYAAPAPELSNT